ncbi:MAG: PqqD family protein [Pyrinomonadaceae bacterium]
MSRDTSPRTSPSAGARPLQQKRSDERILERSDTVLWSLAQPGIVLHNFARRLYLELDEVGYRAWAYLDGARTVEEVVVRCCTRSEDGDGPSRACERHVREIVDTLVEHRFVEERVA